MENYPEKENSPSNTPKASPNFSTGIFNRLFAFNASNFIIIAGLFLILTTGVMVWLTLSRIKTIERTDIRHTLENILLITNESIFNWYIAGKAYIETWTTSFQLRDLTKALLNASHNREALLADAAMTKVRRLLKDSLILHGYSDFFIIAPDYRNIASMHKESIGKTNLIATQGQILPKVFRGHFQLSHPFMVDASQPDKLSISENLQPRQFLCAPIKDEKDKVIAALSLQIEPDHDISHIVHIGRFGDTGETYAFDKSGRLLTRVRFEGFLHKVGLLKPGEQSVLNVTIRDPGMGMTKGYRPSMPNDRLPLTRMAGQAVAGNTGIDLDGYRDYRGVHVVGAWTWVDELNFGLAIEIDRSEAYLSFNNTRFIVLIGLGTIISMFLMFSIMLVLNRIKILHIAQKLEQKHIELKRTQTQLVQSEKMAGLGTLVAGVAHEINNPTNFVNSCSQNLEGRLKEFKSFIIKMLGDTPDPETVHMFEQRFEPIFKNLSAVRDGSHRIKQIVTELRTFSRLDEAEQKRVHIIPGLDSTIKLIQTNYLSDIEVERDFLADPVMDCRPAQLNQVFMNVMINACQAIMAKKEQFGETISGKLKVSTAIEKESLLVSFQDNGCGMSEKTQQKIFEPFFTTKDVGEGTGLGLSIAYGIIEKHQGQIHIDSQIGEGTTFTIKLPLNLKPADHNEI